MPPLFYPTSVNARHKMIVPAPKFGDSPSDLNFEIKLSGMALLSEFKAPADGSWRREDLYITRNNTGFDDLMQDVLPFLPPPAPGNTHAFIPTQWVVYVGLNAVLNTGQWTNSGFAVHHFEMVRGFDPKTFNGIKADIAVRDKDGAATLYRIGYQATMYGHFIEVDATPPEE